MIINYKITIISTALILSIWMLSGLFITKEYNDESNDVQQEFNFQVLSIEPQNIELYHQFPGILQNKDSINILSMLDAKVLSIEKREGEQIKKNETILKLETPLGSSKLEAAQLKVKNQELKYEKTKALYSDKYSSKSDLLDAEYELKKAHIDLIQEQENIENHNIKSNVAGVIQTIGVRQGDIVKAKNTEIATILPEKGHTVKSHVGESLLQKLKLNVGSKSEIHIKNNEIIDGKLIHIQMISKNHTYEVEIEPIANTLNHPIGTAVEVLLFYNAKDVYVIPKTSLGLGENGSIGIKILKKFDEVHFIPIEIVSENDFNFFIRLKESNLGALKLINHGHAFLKARNST